MCEGRSAPSGTPDWGLQQVGKRWAPSKVSAPPTIGYDKAVNTVTLPLCFSLPSFLLPPFFPSFLLFLFSSTARTPQSSPPCQHKQHSCYTPSTMSQDNNTTTPEWPARTRPQGRKEHNTTTPEWPARTRPQGRKEHNTTTPEWLGRTWIRRLGRR
jgi:hypothetical protein